MPSKKPPKPKFDPEAKHVLLGYARVSMADQNPDLQIDALKAAGCERIFYDQASGAGAKRPELDNLLREARENDIIIVWKLDRLGRSVRQVLNIFWELDQKGVKLKVLTETWLDTANPVMAAFTLQIMAAFSELEKAIIGERTRAGLAAAKARGRVGGRASYATDEQVLAVERLGPTKASKRLGYKTPAAYIRRLAVAKANQTKEGEKLVSDRDPEYQSGYADGRSGDPIPPDATEEYKRGHTAGAKDRADAGETDDI